MCTSYLDTSSPENSALLSAHARRRCVSRARALQGYLAHKKQPLGTSLIRDMGYLFHMKRCLAYKKQLARGADLLVSSLDTSSPENSALLSAHASRRFDQNGCYTQALTRTTFTRSCPKPVSF